MLKIKDNVDLKELEKFGIEHEKTQFSDYYYCKDFKISTKKHHLIALNGGGSKRFDKLYDLIQANLVEKVSDKNV